MVVLYSSEEPYSPAMLEAALIDKHLGHFPEHLFVYFVLFPVYTEQNPFNQTHVINLLDIFGPMHTIRIPQLSSPGRPGCRNVKRGGGNAIPPSSASESWYSTYVVYRSFKFPPPIPKLDIIARAGA